MSAAAEGSIHTVVIGVGNDLYQDEGVGVYVARELETGGLPPGVGVVDGAVGGLNLLFEMEGARRVVIVDAADMGETPGTVRVFTPEEVRLQSMPRIASLHQVGLAEVLALGPAMGVSPEVHVVGIQPQQVAPGFELTATVAAAVPHAVAEVRRLCRGES